jgi:hypothetical protein
MEVRQQTSDPRPETGELLAELRVSLCRICSVYLHVDVVRHAGTGTFDLEESRVYLGIRHASSNTCGSVCCVNKLGLHEMWRL